MTTDERLTAFITRELLTDRGLRIGPDDELLLSGLLDSLGVMALIAFIETELGVKVPPGDVTIDHFASVRAMDAYLSGRQNGAPHA